LYLKYFSTSGNTSAVISHSITFVPGGTNIVTTPVLPSGLAIFTRSLKAGITGGDVRALQIFLNTHGFILALGGPGSPGLETNLFGALTRSALIKFQEANAKDILAPLGLTHGTGIFGPATMAFVNAFLAR
jgi:peptidoglycan hydrolase-like protein with peptidoglycan-binding domain